MSSQLCDICTRRDASKICLCVYPCPRLCTGCIGTHCTSTNSGHSLESVAALGFIRSRGDIQTFFTRQQFFQDVLDGLNANLSAVRSFKEEVETFFVQLATYHTSKIAEIETAERAIEASVSQCVNQIEALKFVQIANPRNRLEFILAQGGSQNFAELRKELTIFSASFGQSQQFMRLLDSSIQVVTVAAINVRGPMQVIGPPVLAGSVASGNDQIQALQKAISELRMENAAKDQTMATVKNNRDELKAQFQAKRQEYEQTIKQLERRTQSASGPTSSQDTIQDLKDERRRLLDNEKQYQEAVKQLKSEKMQLAQRCTELEAAKGKIENDAVRMALILRDKMPMFEGKVQELTKERDGLLDLRNRLERLFSNISAINIGCNEGQVLRSAIQIVNQQKRGGMQEVPDIIRIVMMGGL